MTPNNKNLEMTEKFDQRYRLGEAEILRQVESAVCGCDYGGTSWTTETEAVGLGSLLKLTPGATLLEIGSGSGWPALYLAEKSGCAVTLTDVSGEALRVAAGRAEADGMKERCRIVEASGDELPFAAGAFDAIGHSDVLCCLEEKLAVLKECRRVIADSGTMAFSVIHMCQGASAEDTGRVAAAGPSLVEAPASYPEMLMEAGWHIEHQTDITKDFAGAVRRMTGEFETHAEALCQLLGEKEFDDQLARLHGRQEVIAAGLSRRAIFAVTPVRD